MVQLEVCGKTWSQFSFNVNCLICTHEPFLLSRYYLTWRSFSTLSSGVAFGRTTILYLLIHSSLCLINSYWAAAVYPGKEPSVMFTYISKKWLLSLRSFKEREKPDVMNVRMECCTEWGHPMQSWGWGMWPKKVSSRRRNLNSILKHSYEFATQWRWVGISQAVSCFCRAQLTGDSQAVHLYGSAAHCQLTAVLPPSHNRTGARCFSGGKLLPGPKGESWRVGTRPLW